MVIMYSVYQPSPRVIKEDIHIITFRGHVGNDIKYDNIKDDIKNTFESNTPIVLLDIDCLGGSPQEAEAITKYIDYMKHETNKPVYSFITNAGTSACYYISCVGNKIYALNSSIVGSIGVYYRKPLLTSVIERLGIDQKNGIIKSGKYKNDDHDIIEKSKLLHNNFIRYVKKQRGLTNIPRDNGRFNGKTYLGEHAIKNGLIDNIGLLDIFMAKSYNGHKLKYVNRARQLPTNNILGTIIKMFVRLL